MKTPPRKRSVTQREWMSLGVLAAQESAKAAQAGNDLACEYFRQIAEKCDHFVETTPRLKAVS